MTFSISAFSTTQSCPLPHDYQTKVTLYWERFYGWKFDIAKKLLDGYSDANGSHPGILHSGYAALDIILSSFESIGKHLNGYTDQSGQKSGHYFKEGVKSLIDTKGQNQVAIDKLIDSLWSGARCGLYHCGQTKNKIIITAAAPAALCFSTDDEATVINPHMLVDALSKHFDNYKDLLLRNGEASPDGQKFLARYDFENQ